MTAIDAAHGHPLEESGPTRSKPTRKRGFRSDVQGLRAIAVGAVLLYHAGIPFLPGGYVGVDVFFVISGFLISSHLLDSLERTGRIRFGEFYARRVRRILPASLVVAALVALAAVAIYPPLATQGVLQDALATFLYVPNVWFAIQNTDYLADHSASPFQHYWSLGVEEQFYLFWPLIILAVFLVARRRRRVVVIVVAALAALSFAACVILTPLNQPLAFFMLPLRAWELLAGALVAALLRRGPVRITPGIAAAGGWLGIAMILAACALFDARTPFPGAAAVLPVAGAALVIAGGSVESAFGPTRMLSVKPMQFIGLISYSLYLVHWPLLVLPQAWVGESQPLSLTLKILLGVVLAVPLAYLLFRFVESPLRAPSPLTSRRPRVTLLAALAVTVVLALGAGAGSVWAGTRTVQTGESAEAAPTMPTAPPHATSFVPDNLRPSLESAAGDLPRLYADGCHRDVATGTVQECVYGEIGAATRIAVFGDSHAAQWFPAVEVYAEAMGGIEIASYTKSSCPAVTVTVLDKSVPYQSCDRWRAAVLASLVAAPPDVVLISSYAWYPLDGVEAEEDRRSVWAEGVEHTVSTLESAGSRVLIVADTPRYDDSPAICASAHPLDVDVCAGDPEVVLDAEFARSERAAAVEAGGSYSDLTPYICGEHACPPIVDDVLVYRDVNHLTATFVRYLEPVLGEVLDSLRE